MAVEAPHLRNGKDSDGAKGSCCYREYLAFRDVSTKLIVCRALKAVEGNLSGSDVSLQSSLSHLLGKGAGHDHLVLHLAEGQLFGGGIAAVEAHECILQGIGEFVLDILLEEILGNCIVNVQKCYRILADHCADELAESAVNVNLTGNRDSLGSQTAVHIARHKSELGLEGRPAFSGNGHVLPVALMIPDPVL